MEPITRIEKLLSGETLTPITRKEKILAGENIEPITREEYFLKEYGGGGGSAETVYRIEPQTATTVNSQNPLGPMFTFENVSGFSDESITVTFNGTEYTCLRSEIEGAYVYGATIDFSGQTWDYSEYPFAIVAAGEYIMLYTPNEGTYSISAQAEVKAIVPTGTLYIEENGLHDVTRYAEAEVDVPTGIQPSGTLQVTSNGLKSCYMYANVNVQVPTGITPTGTKTIIANGTHDVTDYASASVQVPASAVVSGTKSITENGTGIDVTNYAAVDVNVASSGGIGKLIYETSLGHISTESTTAVTLDSVSLPYADSNGVPYADVNSIWLVDIESDQENGFQHSRKISECYQLSAESLMGRTTTSIFTAIIDNVQKKVAADYGVYVNSINYAANRSQDTTIALRAKYSASSSSQTGIIDGNYTLKVYKLTI